MDNDTLKETVRSANPIAEVISEFISLHKSGQNYVANCPFHEDKTPSFSISPDKGLFHCFGCGASGDVFTFIEKIKNISFYDTLKFLAARKNIPVKELSYEEQNVFQEKHIKENILRDATDFYHRELLSHIGKPAYDYLTLKRKLTPDTLKKFKVGFAPGGGVLIKHLLKKGYPLEQIETSGLITKSETTGEVFERFRDRIVFPNILHNKIVHTTARALHDSGQPKYLHLPGEIKYLYNEQLLLTPSASRLSPILTEGIPDALTLLQLGFTAVALYGTQTFKPEWIEKFSSIEKVFIFLDNDTAGKSATLHIAEMLKDKARIVTLPEGIKDANEYFCRGAAKENFEKIVSSAQTPIEHKISSIPTDTEKSKLFDALKPVLHDLAALEDVEAQNVLLHILKPHFSLTQAEIKLYQKQVKTLRKQIQKEKQAAAQQEKQKELTPLERITDEEKHEALALLKNPQLLDIFLHDIEKLGCVGEEENKLLVSLALTSRKLNDPISLIIKGESSAGKNYLVKSVAQVFPDEDVEERTRLTSHALFYKEKDALKHKALIVYERHGSEESDYSIRSLQSEKKLIIEVPVKDEATGKYKTEKYEVNGPVCFIETTTRPHVHPENETRCFDIYIDESREQTRRIFTTQDRRYLPKEELPLTVRAAILNKHKNAQRLLETLPVIIPYIKHIKFPLEPLRVRRDRGRFLSMIEASALWHQHQRERQTIHDTDYIVANLDDYVLAFRLANKVLSQTMKEVTPKTEALISACLELNGTPITRAALIEKLNWNPRTVTKYLHEAVTLGCLEITDGGPGNSHFYKLLKNVSHILSPLLPPEDLKKCCDES